MSDEILLPERYTNSLLMYPYDPLHPITNATSPKYPFPNTGIPPGKQSQEDCPTNSRHYENITDHNFKTLVQH